MELFSSIPPQPDAYATTTAASSTNPANKFLQQCLDTVFSESSPHANGSSVRNTSCTNGTSFVYFVVQFAVACLWFFSPSLGTGSTAPLVLECFSRHVVHGR